MANHNSTKKSIRQIATRTEVNKARKSRIKTFLKKVEQAIEEGKQKPAQEALIAAQSELFKGVKTGIFKLNTASRKMSRLSARIKTLKA